MKPVCGKICSCAGDGYGIFYEDELMDLLPENARTRETLEAVLKQLANCGNIEVKYARGNAFCIKCIRPFTQAEETAPSSPAAERKAKRAFPPAAAAAIGAAAGGAIGSFICGLIFGHAF